MRSCRRAIHAIVSLVLLCASGVAAAAPAEVPQEQSAGTVKPAANGIDYSTARFERIVSAVRVSEGIVVDGRLDEAAWKSAQPANNFIQWEPKPGMPASQATEVRFLYDDRNLYIGVRCFDSDPDRIIVSELRKDFDPMQDDGFGIFLDTLHDQQSGFLFQTNAAGARRDVQVSQDGEQMNPDWDGVWDVKAAIDAGGWVAEIVIPFKTLRFASAQKQEWGVNLLRRIRRTNEESYWVPLPRRYRLQRASMAGTLTGVDAVDPGRNFKIKPYLVSSVAKPEGLTREFDRDAGLDVKYGLTQSMTLDATFRTDFSQVEVDQQVVNLTRYSVFFPEKREFFLENSGAFAIGGGGIGGRWGGQNVIPFFSRQIGLGKDEDDNTVPIPIVGGARASGKVGSYDIGLLGMRTGQDGGNPANTFVVGRLRKNFPGNSTVGTIMTSRQSTTAGNYNRLYGVDTFLRFFDKLEITSYLLRTDTPDVHGADQARMASVMWRDNDFNLRADYEEVQPDFNPEVGFVRRGSMINYTAMASWRPRPRNNRVIRNYDLDLSTNYYASPSGRLETRSQYVQPGIIFQNSSSLRLSLSHTFDRLDEPYDIYDTDEKTVTLPVGDYTWRRVAVGYNSDRSRAISANFDVNVGEFWNGRNRGVRSSIEFRPNYHFNIDISCNYNDITLPQGAFTTNVVGVRMLYSFTSRAFLNAFLQYNSTTDEFSANTRFNIIHRPLSDLFIVYNERRDTLTHALMDRALAIKFTNMFDF